MGETWRICVDTGGTFTDAVGVAPDGSLHRAKVPSDRLDAPLVAARELTGTSPGDPLPPIAMRLATTRGTNALLERKGATVALFITEGFGDLLRIGTQQRPDLFARNPARPQPLHGPVVELSGRVDASGRLLRPLDEKTIRAEAKRLLDDGVDAAAVCLLHGWKAPEQEQRVAELLRDCGFPTVAVSSETAPHIGALFRAETTVVEATLTPVLRDYVRTVKEAIGDGTLHLLTSAGGLVAAAEFRAADSLLSGPAGGVVGAARAGRSCGVTRFLAFDMGGTSTDVSRYDGDHEYVFEHSVGDAHLLAPALHIETVAAGGGSICGVRRGRLHVGPESAGADPGPACYGRGGPLTLTDVNYLVGRLAPSRFPFPLDVEAAEMALISVTMALAVETGESVRREEILHGFLDIADERMAHAIRSVSLRRGHDPADHALVAFGGAGGQHACGVAERLGITSILVPDDAGLLSAEGLRSAVVERFATREILRPLEAVTAELESLIEGLGAEACDAVRVEARDTMPDVRRVLLRMRFVGQDSSLDVERRDGETPADAFLRRYEEVFGHLPGDREIELVSLRVVASTPPLPDPEPAAEVPERTLGPAYVFHLEDLQPGDRVRGPTLVSGLFGTTWVAEHWTATLDAGRTLRLIAGGNPAAAVSRPASVDRELFTQRFEALAVEMGTMLQRTAVSTNVKERLDFSCALLDPSGRLVVNAPHVPVHLGSLGLCVRTVMERVDPGPGDIIVVNHPAFGGSHLPDVTVLQPVHADDGTRLGWVANRAHHAELGGVRPGSMPPDATRLADEGVVLPPIRVVEAGTPRWDRVENALKGAVHPTRRIEDNMADLRAAVAACRMGAEGLRALAAEHGASTVRRHMTGVLEHAAGQCRRALEKLDGRDVIATDTMDDGTPIAVHLRVNDGRATVDFNGCGDVHNGNLNATPAIVRSAVLYALRLLVDEPLPLNEGLMDPVDVILRPGSLLDPPLPDDPTLCPAVVGGNVETSQRLVDVLLRGLGLAASSQGTMNNVTWGNERVAYYETLGGGCGADGFADGGSGMHSHMTNTRITDPEVVEHRYPVRLERFSLRHGSGGEGRHRGGDGLVRETVFLEPMTLSVLTQRRTCGPPGHAGGEAGTPGTQHVLHADGTRTELGSLEGLDVGTGDRLVMETPGGGGWEPPSP